MNPGIGSSVPGHRKPVSAVVQDNTGSPRVLASWNGARPG
ncbi:hypothetical protein PflQ2_2046 [Pseudomonas fluorescens Q2-87]|uniref:Uncharacterized protein n=1 Tax=Pseudomonas fluorescens (strain Q2-87) TaxID=1038922 RepID=J2Y5V9_PSEFQ|nr:hypothetical protein PflQ2_2046 [Pseudomonas fluorescens Q2-87]